MESLCRLFPVLSPEKARDFIILELVTASRLYQMANLSDLQLKVLKYPEFIDFEFYYRDVVKYILHGLLG